jgi:tetratricopeptide (TPR) repeat protein
MRIVTLVIAAAALGACSGHPFQRFFSSGEQYLAAGQYPEAVIQFQNAARADPQSSAAQMRLGQAYAALKDPDNAAAAYERACALDRGNKTACIEAASQFLAIGDFDRAATEARTVLDADHANLEAQLILASALAGVRRFAEAEERVAAALAASPDNARAYRTLGDIQRQRGNALAAETSLLKAIALDPSSPESRVALAQIYFDTDRHAEGEQQLRSALDAKPADLEANLLFASYLTETEQCLDAEPYWLNVAAQSPDSSGVLSLADYYMSSGRPDDALRVLEPLTSKPDDGGVAKSRIAAILYDRGDRAKATQVVDDLLADQPSNVNALVLKARMSLAVQDIANARDYAHRAAEMAPRAAAVREVLAAIDSER